MGVFRYIKRHLLFNSGTIMRLLVMKKRTVYKTHNTVDLLPTIFARFVPDLVQFVMIRHVFNIGL